MTNADGILDEGGTRMLGVTFPGDSTVRLDWHDVPHPGQGQVVIRTAASGICGSDLRNAYRERRDRGERTYTGCIGGHEFAGTVVEAAADVHALTVGDLVLVYHVAGCGQCTVCRGGYLIHCESERRRAYGNQRDGGHAPYVVVDALTCVRAPDGFDGVDAALLGCGFGTAYEGLGRVGVDGRDDLLVVGLGPLGLAVGMVARALGARTVRGVELSAERRSWAGSLGIFDEVTAPGGDDPDCTVSVDTSGSPAGRRFALRSLRTWGRCALLGEGGDVTFDVSEELLHKEVTLSGSWVTSVPNMAACARLLAERGLHPGVTVQHRMPLTEAGRAYRMAAGQNTGKVCLVFDGT